MRYAAPNLPYGFAFAAMAWAHGGQEARYAIRTAQGIEASQQSFWRAASISKVVVGQVARAVVGQASLHADASTLLGWPLRHPRFPDQPITVAQLASHTAGLTDAGGYVLPDGGSVEGWFAQRGDALFGGAAPGARFDYSNLGYLVLAALAETVSGTRFDALAQRHVFGPLGIEAGFNWAGLGSGSRAARLPTFRKDRGQFVPQIDQEIGVEQKPETYRPGRDTARLSPQGGLRISLDGALVLARGLAGMDTAPLITPQDTHVDPQGGVMDGYGWGVQSFAAPNFYPRPLVGHFANAYGFAGGVWYDAQADFAFVIALNGLEMGEMRPVERAMFAEAAILAERRA